MHSNLGKVGGWDGTALSRWDDMIMKSMTRGETEADTLTLMNICYTSQVSLQHLESDTYWANNSAR